MKVGQVEIHTIVEMQGPLMPISAVFPHLSDSILGAERAHLASEGALDADGNMMAAIRSFVLRTPEHVVVVDTGVGNDKDRDGNPRWHMKSDTAWMDGLAAAGVSPEEVDLVILTHLHVDHVGWNTRLVDGRWVPTFSNARTLITRTEYEFWAAGNETTPNQVFIDSVQPVMQAGLVDLVAHDAELAPHLRFLPTPGHTPGHASVLVDGAAVIAGDVLHSPLQFHHPELSPRFDSDPMQSVATRAAFLERFADGKTPLFLTHPPASPVLIVSDAGRFTARPA